LRHGLRLVEHQHLADVLDGVRARALADARQRHFALVAVERRRAHLDQLVMRERPLDLGHHGIGQAFLAELKDRVQGVGARPECLALGGRERRARTGLVRQLVHSRTRPAQGITRPS
jgi:hypothetical protein